MPDLSHAELESACAGLGFTLAPAQLALLERYAGLLRGWNRRINLISRRDSDRILSYHVLDSLAVSSAISIGSSVADIGSGAGLPGIPLAIARPDLKILLVESSHKKCLFLNTAVCDLGLDNAWVIEGRVELLRPLDCTVLLSRLTGPVRQVIKQVQHQLSPGSRLILFKTACGDMEIERAAKSIAQYGLTVERALDVILPVSGIKRRFVILQRHRPFCPSG
ncbi:MAG: 16S rRNA (guanine(527)-N(7))-methyltransferase RsmG [candidate division WOR-3 bacterium]